jgi:hypothetical protein
VKDPHNSEAYASVVSNLPRYNFGIYTDLYYIFPNNIFLSGAMELAFSPQTSKKEDKPIRKNLFLFPEIKYGHAFSPLLNSKLIPYISFKLQIPLLVDTAKAYSDNEYNDPRKLNCLFGMGIRVSLDSFFTEFFGSVDLFNNNIVHPNPKNQTIIRQQRYIGCGLRIGSNW